MLVAAVVVVVLTKRRPGWSRLFECLRMVQAKGLDCGGSAKALRLLSASTRPSEDDETAEKNSGKSFLFLVKRQQKASHSLRRDFSIIHNGIE
jgi:hypothetical protein